MSNAHPHRDTSAWILQVWASFGVACAAAVYGLWNLPIEPWQQGYLAMGVCFTLGSTFTLAKTIRDNREQRVDTGAWIFQSWAAFAISIGLTAAGIFNLSVETWVQGYAGLAALFLVTTAFTLAKTIRDNQAEPVGMPKPAGTVDTDHLDAHEVRSETLVLKRSAERKNDGREPNGAAAAGNPPKSA